MKINIPRLGDYLQLTTDWTFSYILEHRNYTLRMTLTDNDLNKRFPDGTPVTMPAGTVLKVDRIYIRQGAPEFDSITFRVMQSPDKRLLSKSKGGTAVDSVRFFVKLDDANNIEAEKVDGPRR